MKVLQINTRCTQGGAGRVVSDLHQRLRGMGVDSFLAYGYASGISDDPAGARLGKTRRLATRRSVLANFATHRMAGLEFALPHEGELDALLAWADVVHVHTAHHYFLPFFTLLRKLHECGLPIVYTAHDWWWATGRCTFPGRCTDWKTGCGTCGAGKSADPPVYFDLSGPLFSRRRRLIGEIKDRLHIVAPSAHMAADMKFAFPSVPVHLIRNPLDIEFEEALKSTKSSTRQRPGPTPARILITAADLSLADKTNPDIVEQLLERTDVQLITAGKHSPFSGNRVTNLGYLDSREMMLSQLDSCDAYLFTSIVDNAPMVLVEALCSGTPVLASKSPASEELLALVDGRPFFSIGEVIELVRDKAFSKLYDGQNMTDLASRARAVFAGQAWVQRHIDLYDAAVEQQKLRRLRSIVPE